MVRSEWLVYVFFFLLQLINILLLLLSHGQNILAGDEVPYKYPQADDLGFIKAGSKKEHNHSFESFWRVPSLERSC